MTFLGEGAVGGLAGYDVIGDVHGHVDKLVKLLEQMGYSHARGTWRHPHRQAIFVGDLIDNGPQQLATINIVRDMVAAGSALVTMGNHEFNAIAWRRGWRERSEKNFEQHVAFLDEVADGSLLHDEIVEWFTRLPLWLDLGGLRVIHACWDEPSMSVLAPHLAVDGSMSEVGLNAAASKDSVEYDAVEILLKGPEVPLPNEFGYLDKKQRPRVHARYRWWSDAPATYQHRAHLPSDALDLEGQPHPGFPEVKLPVPLPVRPYEGPPVIYGHYWQTGRLRLTSPGTACVDYSAGKGGPLVAYRWNGENTLTHAHLIAAV